LVTSLLRENSLQEFEDFADFEWCTLLHNHSIDGEFT